MLIIFNKLYSGKRNALSLYFELEFDNIIKIHRTYFVYNSFISYLKNQDNFYPDIRDSELEVNIDDLYRLLNSDKTINKLTFYDQIKLLFINSTNEPDLEQFVNRLNDLFYGCTFFDSGHIVEKDKSMEIIDNLFNIVYPTEENRYDRLEPRLDDKYANIEDLRLKYRVFDVGQANCSAILSFDENGIDYKVACVFDFGCEKTKRNNVQLKDMIKNIDDSTTIIISHFDSDHINLIQYNRLPPTIRWLFSSTPPKSKKGYKLFQLLLSIATRKSSSGNIYIYDAPYRLSNYLRIEEKQDNSKDNYQSTILNANSVISIIETNKNRILIPGDALYHDFPQGVFNTDYTVVLIPHHCCYYPSPNSRDCYTNIINTIVSNTTIGIAQCGNNTYGHANVSHLSWYKNNYICDGATIYDNLKNPIKKIGMSKNRYIDFDL